MNAFSLHYHLSRIATDSGLRRSSDCWLRVRSKCKVLTGRKSRVYRVSRCHSSDSSIGSQWKVGDKRSQKRSDQCLRCLRSQQLLHCHSSSLPKNLRFTVVSRPLLSPVTAIKSLNSAVDRQCSERTFSYCLVIAFQAIGRTVGLWAAICSLFESFVRNQIRSWSCQREFLQQQARVTSHLQCPFSSG